MSYLKTSTLKHFLRANVLLSITIISALVLNLVVFTPLNASADTSITSAVFNPNNVDPLDSTNLIVTAQDSTDVEVDLSPIGGNNNQSLDYNSFGLQYELNIDVPEYLPGDYDLTITANGSTGVSSTSATLTINEVAPTIENIDILAQTPNDNLEVEVEVSDKNTLQDIKNVYIDLADMTGYTATTIELYDDGNNGDSTPNDGVYSNNSIGLPNDTQAGTYNVDIIVEDNENLSASETVEVELLDSMQIQSAEFLPPSINPLENTKLSVDSQNTDIVTADFSSINGTATDTLTYNVLTQRHELEIENFPKTLSGSYDFTVTATGVNTSTDTATLEIKNIAPQIGDINISSAAPGVNIDMAIDVEDDNTLTDISSVTVDVATLVAGQPGIINTLIVLYDDMTHGDLTANDGKYTNNTFQIPTNTTPGDYNVTITATDNNGLTDSKPETVTISSSLGISANFTPGSGLPGVTTTIDAVVSSPNGLDAINAVTVDLSAFSGNIVNLLDQGNGAYSLSNISVPTLGAKAYSFALTATDTAGGESTVDAIFNITNDPIGITAISAFPSITDPNTDITIEVELSDANGVTDVSSVIADLSDLATGGGTIAETFVSLNYTETISVDGEDPVYKFSSDISIPEGVEANTYTLNVEATDKANTTDQKSVEVEVINTPTIITSAAFTPATGLPGATTTLETHIEDLNGPDEITSVTADFSALNAGTQSLINLGNGIFSLSNIVIPEMSADIKEVSITAYAGATSLDDRNVNFTILNQAPSIETVTVQNATLIPGSTTANNIGLTVSDLNGFNDINAAYLNMSNIGGEESQSFVLDQTLGAYFNQLNAKKGTAAGTYVLPISIEDSAGATSTSSTTVYVNNVDPTITNSYFSPSSVKPSSTEYIKLNVKVDDANGFNGLIVTADLSEIGLSSSSQLYDNGSGGDLVANDGMYTLGNVDLSENLNPGDYTVKVSVKDNNVEVVSTAQLTILDNDAVTIDQVNPTYGTLAGGQSVLIKIDSPDVNFLEERPTVYFVNGTTLKSVSIEMVKSTNEFYIITPSDFTVAGLMDIRVEIGQEIITRTDAFEMYDPADFPGITIAGGYGITEGSTNTLTLMLTETRETSTTVNLFNNNPEYISSPTTVVIPSGYRMMDFDITALEENSDYSDNIALINASATGFIPTQKAFKITDNDNTPLNISPSTSNINEGETAELYVSVPSALSNSLTINLTASDIAILSVPSDITIAAGEIGSSFTVSALNDSNDSNEAITITATATDYSSVTADITIVDDDDVTAPTVTSVDPVTTTLLPVTSNIVITFSEDIDQTNISNLISLSTGVTAITSLYTYNPTTYQVTIDPVESLEYSTNYMINITSDIEDLSGNTMAADYSATFTTEAYYYDDDDDHDRRRRRTYYPSYPTTYQYPSTTTNPYYQYQSTTPTNTGYYNTYPQAGTTPYGYTNSSYGTGYYARNSYQNYGTNYMNNYYSQNTGYYTNQPTNYQPQIAGITRGEYVKQLLNSRRIQITQGQSSPFRDVKIGNPYNDYVTTAAALGWLNGFGGNNNTFRPNQPITNLEMNYINSVLGQSV